MILKIRKTHCVPGARGELMTKRKISRGTCYFCDNTYAKNGIVRHLRACDARKEAMSEVPSEKTRTTTLFHLLADGDSDYWLHLEMPADATLQDLDSFLRRIWLECCGHLSAFTIGDRRFDSHPVDDDWGFYTSQTMDVALGEILEPSMEFSHEYDFGTTTALTIRVYEKYEGRIGKDETVRVLARNNPPDIRCYECDGPATTWCLWCHEDYWLLPLCDKHAEESEHYEEDFLPIVNSPRTGMCGYTGPYEEAWS